MDRCSKLVLLAMAMAVMAVSTASASASGKRDLHVLRANSNKAGSRGNDESNHKKVLFSAWDGAVEGEQDPLHQVADFLEQQEQKHALEMSALEVSEGVGVQAMAKAETGVGKVHAFCEICILIMQMKERGQPHLCAGLNPDYFISCVENLESILRADKAVTYWLRSGCLHLDREGPEVVKPCPAHAICAWVPNLFADVGIVSPRNELAPLCPRDFKYLPRIPRKPAAGQ
jgi:hypothetical protein